VLTSFAGWGRSAQLEQGLTLCDLFPRLYEDGSDFAGLFCRDVGVHLHRFHGKETIPCGDLLSNVDIDLDDGACKRTIDGGGASSRLGGGCWCCSSSGLAGLAGGLKDHFVDSAVHGNVKFFHMRLYKGMIVCSR
jgi:hypothetical protein